MEPPCSTAYLYVAIIALGVGWSLPSVVRQLRDGCRTVRALWREAGRK